MLKIYDLLILFIIITNIIHYFIIIIHYFIIINHYFIIIILLRLIHNFIVKLEWKPLNWKVENSLM
jgi:hypothetical protein